MPEPEYANWINIDWLKYIKPSENKLGVMIISTKDEHYYTTRIAEFDENGLHGVFAKITPEDNIE